MKKEELQEILSQHSLWLQGMGGKRANLSGADLSRVNLTGADLSGANLTRAYLSGANLSRANLIEANLTGANLTGAYLTGAYLTRAYLTGAYLSGANLTRAYLSGANLSRAYLTRAYLTGAYLFEANLSGADLSRVNLYGADLSGANIQDAKLPSFQIVTQGTMKVYKKARGKIVELIISPSARRTSSLIGRKCRCEFAYVKRILNLDGSECKNRVEVLGDRDGLTLYKKGCIVKPDKYDDDIRVECTHGIHFFITFEEAKNY